MPLDELVIPPSAYCAAGRSSSFDDTGCRARLDSIVTGIRDSDFLEITLNTYCTYLQSEQTDRPSVIVHSGTTPSQ